MGDTLDTGNKDSIQKRDSMSEAPGGLQLRAMTPPPFQLHATNAIQRNEEDPTETPGAVLKIPAFESGNTSLEADGDRGSRERKTRNYDESKGGTPLTRVRGEHFHGEGLRRIEAEHDERVDLDPNGVAKQGVSATGQAGVRVGREGVSAHVFGEAKNSLLEFEMEFPREYQVKLWGEDSRMQLKIKVEGFCGVEGKAALEAHFRSMLKNEEPGTINEDDIVKGIDMQAEAFAGAKLSITAEARHFWQMKGKDHYRGRLQSNMGRLIKWLQSSGEDWSKSLDKLSTSKAAEILANRLYSNEGEVMLGGLGAKIEGSAGIGAEGVLNFGYEDGKIRFQAKGGASWGLGIGGGIEVALDVKHGVLFGLVVGGDVFDQVKPHILQIIHSDWFMSGSQAIVDGYGSGLGGKL